MPASPRASARIVALESVRERILQAARDLVAAKGWQGALPFTYHVGVGPVRVHMRVRSDFRYRTIWNVIGTVRGTEFPDQWVVAGNHRDAWVYGAVDPVSGTSMMLEAVHGVGELLKSGWRPRRTIVFASWDAEEQGLIGSTEWTEEHQRETLVSGQAPSAIVMSCSDSRVPPEKIFDQDLGELFTIRVAGNVLDAENIASMEAWVSTPERPASAGNS